MQIHEALGYVTPRTSAAWYKSMVEFSQNWHIIKTAHVWAWTVFTESRNRGLASLVIGKKYFFTQNSRCPIPRAAIFACRAYRSHVRRDRLNTYPAPFAEMNTNRKTKNPARSHPLSEVKLKPIPWLRFVYYITTHVRYKCGGFFMLPSGCNIFLPFTYYFVCTHQEKCAKYFC
jgi:hypothetical protein